MGTSYSYSYFEGNKPDYIPDSNSKPTFDPQFGFKNPRIPRESKLSEQEMKALKLKPEDRDYCAHLLKDYLVCRRRHDPIYAFCSRERHAHKQCQVEDFTLRLKEYEREKRLRIRELKKQGVTVS